MKKLILAFALLFWTMAAHAQGTFPGICSSGGFWVFSATVGGIICSTAGGTAIITPPAATASQGLTINQTGPTSGTTTGAATGCTAGNSALVYNSICISSESASISAGGVPYTTALNLALITGGVNSTGQKSVLNSFLFVDVAESEQARDHIAGIFSSVAEVSMGGTNTGANASGTLFALNPLSVLRSGATNIFEVSGAEVDVGIQTGASVRYRLGWSVVDNGNIQAASLDTALEVAAAGSAPGWKTALLLDNIHGAAPLSTTGCVICTDGSANTITTGIDLSTYTISGNFLKSAGFQVSGIGAIGAGTLALAGATLGASTLAVTGAGAFSTTVLATGGYLVGGGATAGVNCSGSPTSSFASSLGIVTHC